MTEFALNPPEAVEVVEDARALQQRLYREIGLSAVAAALNVPLEQDSEPVVLRRVVQSIEASEPARVAA